MFIDHKTQLHFDAEVVNLGCQLETSGKRDSQLIFCLHCIGLWCLDLWTRLWAFTCWLISAGRPSHVDSICFGQVVLRCIKKRAEQVRGSKPGSSIPLYSLLQFLPPHSCLGVLSWWTVHKINFVPPKLVWVFFYHSDEKQNKSYAFSLRLICIFNVISIKTQTMIFFL